MMASDICPCCGQVLPAVVTTRAKIAVAQEQYNLTPAEARLFLVLSDGKPHANEELAFRALGHRQGSTAPIRSHVSRMRPKLDNHGVKIISQGRPWGGSSWQLVMPEVSP